MDKNVLQVKMDKVEKPKPKRFHEPGVIWEYSDGSLLKINEKGEARRLVPKTSKKARRRENKGMGA